MYCAQALTMRFHVSVYTVNNKSIEAATVCQFNMTQLTLCLLFTYQMPEALFKPRVAA